MLANVIFHRQLRKENIPVGRPCQMMFGVVSFYLLTYLSFASGGLYGRPECHCRRAAAASISKHRLSPNRDQSRFDFLFPQWWQQGTWGIGGAFGGIVAHSVVGWNPQQFAMYKCFRFSGINIDTGFQQVDLREMYWICWRICHSFLHVSIFLHTFAVDEMSVNSFQLPDVQLRRITYS